MLDHDAGRLVDVGHQPPGGVEVEDVVERQLLALHLARGRHRVDGRPEVAVEGRALVRVLAVAQVLDLLVGEREAIREHVLAGRDRVAAVARLHLGEVAGDRRLVARAVAERLLREVEPGGGVGAVLAVELLEQQRVVDGIHHHRDVAEVLGRRAQHRRPADVDVLDGVVEGRALRHLVLEGIEVHHHHVDGDDAVLLQLLGVRRPRPAGPGCRRGPWGGGS